MHMSEAKHALIPNDGKKQSRDMQQRNLKDHALLYMHLNDLEVNMHLLSDGLKRKAKR